jgi:putative holliday junction resolvase
VRVLGLDLGAKRIGVAVSDRSGTIASPLCVLQRTGSRAQDHRAIAKLVIEEEAVAIVVGLPLTLKGEWGRAALLAKTEVDELTTVVDVPIHFHDERFTTVTAESALMEARMRADARRRLVDKIAAAVMLQSWLDAQAHHNARGEMS